MAAQRTVVVTGGASGVGLGTARLLGEEGWAAVLVDRDAEGLEAAAAGLRDEGTTVAGALVGDIRDAETATRAVAAAEADGYELRGLVNAAAAVFQGSLWDLDPDDLDRCHAINVRGTFQMMRAAAPAMRAHGGGSIVNVGSGDSFLGERDQLAYCTTKAAVLNMTRAAAMDAADSGVRINCVCPGVVDTPFFRAGIAGSPDPDAIVAMVEKRQPLGLLEADAVAQAIAFLISDRGVGMTGSALVIDGGLSASWWYEPRPAAAA